MLAYLGPETMLPLTSIVAGVAGVVLMFGKTVWIRIKDLIRAGGRLFRKSSVETSVSGAVHQPHIDVKAQPGGGQGGAARLRKQSSGRS
jgi:hypothetical protein